MGACIDIDLKTACKRRHHMGRNILRHVGGHIEPWLIRTGNRVRRSLSGKGIEYHRTHSVDIRPFALLPFEGILLYRAEALVKFRGQLGLRQMRVRASEALQLERAAASHNDILRRAGDI